jgi:hypothetical protein
MRIVYQVTHALIWLVIYFLVNAGGYALVYFIFGKAIQFFNGNHSFFMLLLSLVGLFFFYMILSTIFSTLIYLARNFGKLITRDNSKMIVISFVFAAVFSLFYSWTFWAFVGWLGKFLGLVGLINTLFILAVNFTVFLFTIQSMDKDD